MSYTLVVVESPKKAKTISKVLGPNYIIRPTVGHINDLSKSGKYNLGIDLDDRFKLRYEILDDKKDKVKAIIETAKAADEVLIASDPDREGEAIAFAVAELIPNNKIQRVLFHEITPAGIKKGIANPKPLNLPLYEAQQARRALDRMVGFLVSTQLSAGREHPLSAGRVQSVALRLITDLEREIESFIPEIYYNIFANLNKNGKKIIAKYAGKITTEESANKIIEDLNKSKFIVSNVVNAINKQQPLPPLTTSKLQKYGATRLKFSASKTMKCAQSLYEKGYITYIRTDSARSSPESITELREWLKTNKYSVSKNINVYSAKEGSQDAHEAIRPTNVTKTPNKLLLEPDEAKLYGLIWQFFVASQMPPIEYSTIKVDVKAGKHLLKISGKTLKNKGWSEILADDSIKKDIILPELNKNDELALVKPNITFERKETKPPSRFNDGTLIEELERKGIGRPSTYAAILSKIENKNYIFKSKNMYNPTGLGLEVTDILCKFYSFMDINYTKEMELSLDKIESGETTYYKVISDFFSSFKEELNRAYLSNQEHTDIRCVKCNDHTILRHGMYGYYVMCIACKNTESVDLVDKKPTMVPFKRDVVEGVECPKCSAGMIEKVGKFGPFYTCESYPKCRGTRKIPFGQKCSKCKEGELYISIFNHKPKLACMEYPTCKNIEELPKGYQIDWIEPEKLKPVKNKIVEKISKWKP